MWYLQCLNDSVMYLWDKDSYSVGRKNKDIIIENDDSISRNHGEFTIKDGALYLTDLGSKYGTFVGGSKLTANEAKKLSVDDVIMFGLLQNNQSKFTVKKLNFKVVLSNVKSNEKHELYSALDSIKIPRQSNWERNCTHIVLSEVILTSKVLCALTVGQSIVNLRFFLDVLKAVQSNIKLPEEKDYMPEFNETLLNKNIKLEYKPDRKSLFKDLIFVFLTEKCKKSLEEVIKITGGEAISWQKQELNTETLKENLDKYLFMEDSTEAVNKESKIYKSFHNVIKYLTSVNRRSIPLQEVALAIIHNTRSENCNPQFNRAALLVPQTQTQQSEQILVYDTEHSSATSSKTPSQNDNLSEIPSVVEPSFETQNSTINSGVKRSLEVEITENESAKKLKEDFPSSSGIKKPSNESTQSINQSKISAFFNKKDSNEESTSISNPFTRKRKATTNLNQESKKRPLENISNIIQQPKPVEQPKVVEQPKTVEKPKETTTNISKTLMNNSWLPKEISRKEIQIKDEPEDEVITKLNEMLKDSIIIRYCSVIPRTVTISQTNNSGVKNFKKFKKHHRNVQCEIITDLKKVVVGDETIGPADEEEEEDEMDTASTSFASNSTTQKRPQQRRRFQFAFN